MTGRARGGDDHLRGGDDLINRNFMYGDGEDLGDDVRAGDDTLVGGDRNASNSLNGDAITLRGHARAGDDLLIGGVGTGDLLYYNSMVGDAQVLTDHADAGNDTLVSAAGTNDRMYGDAPEVGPNATTGRDVFVFGPGNGRDLIGDFEPGKDHIELRNFDFDSIDAVLALVEPTAEGSVISFDAANSITILGAVPGAHDFVLIG